MQLPISVPSDHSHPLPETVNFHLWKPCNEQCRYCYATFNDDAALRAVRGGLPEADSKLILDRLAEAGVEKINFVGGEPTLCPWLGSLLSHARNLGFTVSLITNGARLLAILKDFHECLDLVGLSVDSAYEDVQQKIGRGRGSYVQQSRSLFRLLHELEIATKLNTVVTSHNWQENLTEFVLDCRPDRWKMFQVRAVAGQNDGKVDDLLITADQFRAFKVRHHAVEAEGIVIAAEAEEDMIGSYAMVDPLGRFFSSDERHTYSRPILEVGVHTAFRQVEFNRQKFLDRGGLYEVPSKLVTLTTKGKLAGQ